ncbi:hypothetical protein MSAN_00215700 [Mycena sanguinolenta]|uniref:RRM domain-containing protein n=1 Tax=Mycena sanguinolenta TaxID=230812 RepID=A0A8H7DJQ2_9AGAR|nr:hypothetical protein MSAN_00215700 [Mycena sanguinolenta]
MASKPNAPTPPPHPFLQSPTLLVGPLPSHVLEEHVKRVFQGFNPPPALTFTRTKNGRNRGALRTRVDFLDVQSTEKALAIHHLRDIPSLEPAVQLAFSTSFGPKSLRAPDASVAPRLIKSPPFSETELFDLLRPFGPIYSVRIHPIAGALVQFWDEAHAQQAETVLEPHILYPYDPCTLFCSNIHINLDACAFRTYFVDHGTVVNVVIFTDPKTGKSRGNALVTFSQAAEAATALMAMHGTEIQWKGLSVTYHVPDMKRRQARATTKLAPTSKEPIESSAAKDDELRTEKTATSELPAAPPQSEPTPAPPNSRKNAKGWRNAAAQTKNNPSVQQETASAKETPATTPLRSVPTPVPTAQEPAVGIRTEDDEIHDMKNRLAALQALYDTEKQRGAAQEKQSAAMIEELRCIQLRANAENAVLRQKVEQSDATIQRMQKAAELLREELGSVKLQSAAEIELLQGKLETTKRALEMAESRVKMMQLEADRPLWETAKKRREEKEREERAKEEVRRRAAEVEESRRKMREFQEQEKARKAAVKEAEEKERLRREAEEKARREKEERERIKREQERIQREKEQRERERRWKVATEAEEARCRQRDQEKWGLGAWTHARALERLKVQIEEFDKIKFSETQPLTFHVVPWPVLTDPLDLDIEQIDWNAVEGFFLRAKMQLATNAAEYKSLVERVHRLFHPDKWKSRGLLVTVMDENLRKSLEMAGNVVAQAMTPIWRKSRGYTDA